MPDSLDFSEVLKLEYDLGTVADGLIPKVRAGVEFAARTTKDEWREEARGPSAGHARRYPSSIDYTMELDTSGVIGAEVGPNLARRQGSLGFLDEATGGVAAAPQNASRKAAKVAADELEIGITKALGTIL